MTINNYFQLTFYLVSQYMSEIYPTSQGFKQVQFTDDTKLKQVKLFKGEEQLLILSFTEISETQSLVNVLNIAGRLDNALINWEWFITGSNDSIKFPIDDDNNNNNKEIPQDLIEKFKTKFRLLVDDEKVSSIFSNTSSKGPIIEEHTDSESIRSPTPELPYNPPPPPPPPQAPASAHPDNSIFTGSSAPAPTTKRPLDMPDFDDEYEIKSPPPPLTNQLGRGNNNNVVPSIGSDDLNPPGIPQHPTLTPFIDPLQNSQNHHQGMYPALDHPIFGQRQQQQQQGPNSRAPPGARFDDPFGGSSSEGPFGGPLGGPFGGSLGGPFGGSLGGHFGGI